MIAAIIEPIEPQFPLAITILAYVATGALVLILLLLVNIHARLGIVAGKLSAKSSRSSISVKAPAEEPEPQEISEPEPGTPFHEFLTEDPTRRSLTKKEQSKAYRKWRADKGLNWSKSSEDN
ncbi:MAG: hypothetical protein NWT08_01075 [Akkermansiaceae bacterium]|jgi:hypothetical protein|nr:hypothetical protein [Akkermansiaceae bacterium]MDP4645698.1 hypothetical protein [Akkermansiaceae bacterium]MDP4721635.1 hypothetical protein [Akkermansiaceae bacterium]MDP4778807.1 hypothetical protein [Akkermansiaceae bacterium]MDP4846992.1 hypothetical protein [Akkermansiaceae bacterium]